MSKHRRIRTITSALLLLGFVACGNEDGSSWTEQDPNELLESNCFDWPAQDFSPDNFVQDLTPGVSEGETAPDFRLMDVDGNDYTLSELLETKPVFMFFGSYT